MKGWRIHVRMETAKMHVMTFPSNATLALPENATTGESDTD